MTSDVTKTSFTIPQSFPFMTYFAPYVSAQSVIGSAFSGYSTTATTFVAPATGLYQWTVFINSPLTWYINGLVIPNASVFQGYISINSGGTFYPSTVYYTSSPSSVICFANSFFSVNLVRETY